MIKKNLYLLVVYSFGFNPYPFLLTMFCLYKLQNLHWTNFARYLQILCSITRKHLLDSYYYHISLLVCSNLSLSWLNMLHHIEMILFGFLPWYLTICTLLWYWQFHSFFFGSGFHSTNCCVKKWQRETLYTIVFVLVFFFIWGCCTVDNIECLGTY